jgi:OmcA/MtrC family decaheme c-type cytochrome
VNGVDLEVSFDLTDDGVALTSYDEVMRAYVNNGGTVTDYRDAASMANNGGGNYTITLAGAAAEAAVDNRWLFRIRDSVAEAATGKELRTYFHVDFPNNPFAGDPPLAVGGDACAACHGPEGIRVHGSHFIASDGGEPCLTCHGATDGRFGEVASLGLVAHEYHSGLRDEITYPTYMTNCSVCHSEEAQLTAVNAMPVSAVGCLSCHGSMDNDSWDFTNQAFHLDIVNPEAVDCTICHKDPLDGGIARAVVTEFHNGTTTERGGIIWGGVDTAVEEGKKFDWMITSMVDDGVNLTFTWEASYNGVGVDPCNETVGVGAPTFHLGNGGLRTYRSYAQGDDFIIGNSTSAPGQPDPRVNLDAINTVCANGIATTTIPVEASGAAEKGRIALGGKPRVISEDVADLEVQARVPSPTYDWLIGDGAPMARRAIVDTELCLKCHVGSLYQHGGDRVDNVDYCLVCHNAASNEQNVRTATMGIDPSDTYDGRVGQTYEMKTMLHRVHSAGTEGQPPYVIYRGRGVYAFAPEGTVLPNWPGTGDQVVFGSTIDNDGNPGSYVTNHHFESPTYPRAVNDCAACHVADSVKFQPDQTKAMASTLEAGSTMWEDQVDDVLQGAATTACVTCHAGGPAKGHAYQNSWTPQAFEEGRQTIIDAAK